LGVPVTSSATIADVVAEADVAAVALGEVARDYPAVRWQGMPSDADCRAVDAAANGSPGERAP
jgi:hypothetical protein